MRRITDDDKKKKLGLAESIPEEWRKAGIDYGKGDYTSKYRGEFSGPEVELTKQGIDKLNAYRMQAGRNQRDQELKDIKKFLSDSEAEYTRNLKDIESDFNKLNLKSIIPSLTPEPKSGGSTGSTTTKTKPEKKEEATPGTVKYIEEQIKKLNTYRDEKLKVDEQED